MKITRLIILMLIATAICSCDDEVVIGEDLLDDDQIGVHVKSDFDIKAKTITGVSTYTYVSGSNYQSHVVGQIVDPIFGTYSSELFIAPKYSSLPNYKNSTLDSIVLVLDYDTIGYYGDKTAQHELSVYRVVEDFINRDSIFSEETFETGELLGQLSFVPRPKDSINVANRDDEGKMLKLPAQIRIRLSDEFGKELLADSVAAKSDTSLIEAVKGLAIKGKSNDKSILGISMTSTNINALTMYYTQNDTTKKSFSYRIRPTAFSHTEEDKSGKFVEDYIDNTEKGKEYCFLQGFRGLDTEISIATDASLKNKIINSALLTLTVANIANDFNEEDFPSTLQLLAYTENNGERDLIDDLPAANLNYALSVFGGKRKAENDTVTYTLNITDFIQENITNDMDKITFLISTLGKQQTPRNAILFGSDNGENSMKLTVTYTDL